MSTLFCLSDLNMAIMESSCIDAELLRPMMNIKGRKGVLGDSRRKPLLARSFLKLLLPDVFFLNSSWNAVYMTDSNMTCLIKLMNGIADGLSVHRDYLRGIASAGFRVSKDSEILFLRVMADACRSFLETYAHAPADASETLEYWKQETLPAGKRIAVPKPVSEFVLELDSVCSEEDRSAEAYAGMVLLGLLSGFAEKDEAFIGEWLDAFRKWHKNDYPRFANSSWSPEDHLRLIPETGSGIVTAAPIPEAFLPDIEFAGADSRHELYIAGHESAERSSGAVPAKNAHDILEILEKQDRLTIFTGSSGMGKKSVLQRLMERDQMNGGRTVPICISSQGEPGSLLGTLIRILHFPDRNTSWSVLAGFLKGWRLHIYIPDVFSFPHIDELALQISDAITETSDLDIRFFISGSSCPHSLTGFASGVYRFLPLSDARKEQLLNSSASPMMRAGEIRKNPLLWELLDIPLNMYYYLSGGATFPKREINASGFFPVNTEHASSPQYPQTVSAVLYNYLLQFTQPGDNAAKMNAAVLYVLPALAALMKYRNIQSIGYMTATAFFHDAELEPVLHTDILRKYRAEIREEDMNAVFQKLKDLHLLVGSNNLYSFPSDQLLDFCNALHSFNLFDIEIKENVFIRSTYPYEAHTDYFWQLLSTEVLLQYEALLPKGSSLSDHYGAARLYASWATVIFYGNGSDEEGSITSALRGEAKVRYQISVMERCLDILGPVVSERTLPCPAWNYAYYKKRIAELLLSLDSGKYTDTAKQYLLESFTVVHTIVDALNRNVPYPDIEFASKHIYDKYAQFLLQRCYPVVRDDTGLWYFESFPGKHLSDAELETEIYRVLEIASSCSDPIATNRLGLLRLGILPEKKTHPLMSVEDLIPPAVTPDAPGSDTELPLQPKSGSDAKQYRDAYRLFLKSSDMGDFFARGMVCELLLDHADALPREPLPIESAPDGFVHRPRTVGEALKRDLIPDCCIAYIRSLLDFNVYRSIVSESRKSRYATAFHQLGRCYLIRKDYKNAKVFLDAAFESDWSQNDNFGEYDRLLADIRTLKEAEEIC